MEIGLATKILTSPPGSYRWPHIQEAQHAALAEIEQLKALNARTASELDAMWQQRDDVMVDRDNLLERAQVAEERIERASALHPEPPGGEMCWGCDNRWPCPTVQALNGVTEEPAPDSAEDWGILS